MFTQRVKAVWSCLGLMFSQHLGQFFHMRKQDPFYSNVPHSITSGTILCRGVCLLKMDLYIAITNAFLCTYHTPIIYAYEINLILYLATSHRSVHGEVSAHARSVATRVISVR